MKWVFSAFGFLFSALAAADATSKFELGWVARTVSLSKNHQIASNTELNSVFGEVVYLADKAEMGLIRLISWKVSIKQC